MTTRGAIHSTKRRQQLHDFSTLRIGNITPTDVDGLIEYRGQACVLFELKYRDAPLGTGQQRGLMQMVDWIERPTIRACLIVARHCEDDPGATVNAADCLVREWYWRGEWRQPIQPGTTLKQAIFAFLDVPVGVEAVEVVNARSGDESRPWIDTGDLGPSVTDQVRGDDSMTPHVDEIFK